tara:strand:- start:4791 stop:5057 length:267 start_codon:yes stop_codon:yes gene_type:complete
MVKTLKLINKLGLHARASSKLVEISNKYISDIFIEYNGLKVNAKSILGLLSLAASYGTEIKIHIEGTDSSDALNELENLINNKFGESE